MSTIIGACPLCPLVPYSPLFPDSTDLFYSVAEPITPSHVDAMVDEVVLRGSVDAGRLWMRLNSTPLGRAELSSTETEGAAFTRTVFRAPPEALRDGPNRLVLRYDGYNKDETPIDVIGLEAHVGATGVQ